MVRRLFGKKRKVVKRKKKAAPKKKTAKRAPRSKVKIENVVVSASLHKEIPLETVARRLPNTEYNPEQFPGLVLRLNEEKGKRITALVFSSGKIVCTGTKSEDEVPRAIRMIIRELAKAKIKITKKPEMQIQNMVASGDIGMTLNLNKLAFKLPTAEYEPEQFPGLVYKVPKSHITFLLFGTGRIVCTGAKNERQIRTAVRDLVKTLKSVR
jgi:transcription initiation factor TFIID TATA-box-binding protein